MSQILDQKIPVIDLSKVEGSKLTEDILQSIKEVGVDVEVILSDGVKYKIVADSITEYAAEFDLDVAVELIDKAINVGDSDNAKIPGNSILLTPNFSGEFGFEIQFTVSSAQLAEKGLNGNNVKLFYIDYEGKVTDMGKVKLNLDGSVSIAISHASRYILCEEEPVPSGDSRYNLGDANGDGFITIIDALEILKYLARLDNHIIHTGSLSYSASCIVNDSPAIMDVLEVLKFLAKLESKVG